MPVRFQADADFNQIIVSAVVRRSPQIDFRTATAAGLAGTADAEVLALRLAKGACWSLTIDRQCRAIFGSSYDHNRALD